MKKASIFAGVALAFGLVVGAPAAAMAAGGYAPIPDSSNYTSAPGSTVTVSSSGWDPTETVVVTYPDSFTLAASTAPLTPVGGVVSVNLKPSTTGTFQVVFNGSISGQVTANVTVAATLPFTGTQDPAPYLWIGGGALALGIAAVVTVVAVRRERNAA